MTQFGKNLFFFMTNFFSSTLYPPFLKPYAMRFSNLVLFLFYLINWVGLHFKKNCPSIRPNLENPRFDSTVAAKWGGGGLLLGLLGCLGGANVKSWPMGVECQQCCEWCLVSAFNVWSVEFSNSKGRAGRTKFLGFYSVECVCCSREKPCMILLGRHQN